MKQMQVKLSDEADEIVSIYKIKQKLKTKAEAINKILEMNKGLIE
jgi:flavoprotein